MSPASRVDQVEWAIEFYDQRGKERSMTYTYAASNLRTAQQQNVIH